MEKQHLLAIEVSSIAIGYQVLNRIFHFSEIEILESAPHNKNCFFILIASRQKDLLDKCFNVLPPDTIVAAEIILDPHPQLLPALYSLAQNRLMETIAVIETTSTVYSLKWANKMLNSSTASLIEVRTGRGLCGTSFYVLSGSNDELTNLKNKFNNIPAQEITKFEIIDNPHLKFLEFLI